MYRSVYISAQRYIHNLCIDNVASYTNVKEKLVHILIPLPPRRSHSQCARRPACGLQSDDISNNKEVEKVKSPNKSDIYRPRLKLISPRPNKKAFTITSRSTDVSVWNQKKLFPRVRLTNIRNTPSGQRDAKMVEKG